MLLRRRTGHRALLSPSNFTSTSWYLARSPLALRTTTTTTATTTTTTPSPTSRCLVTAATGPRTGNRRVTTTTAPRTTTGQSDRTLATAMGPSNTSPSTPQPQPPLSLTFDVHNIIRVPADNPEEPRARVRISGKGISANIEEVVPVFDACLLVGKLDRARLFLERLAAQATKAPPDEMIGLHNKYLEANVKELIADPNFDRAQSLHKWWDVHISRPGLPYNAFTIACMVKICILSTNDGPALKLLINKYLDTIDYNTRLEVLTIGSILTDQDLSTVTQTVPKTFQMKRGLTQDDLAGEAAEVLEVEEAEEAAKQAQATLSASVDEKLGDFADAALDGPQDIPLVRGMEQRGEGLRNVKRSLELFSTIPDGQDFKSLSLEEMREIQSRLERDSLEAAIECWRKVHQDNMKRGFNDPAGTFGSLLWRWFSDVEAQLQHEWALIDKIEEGQPKNPLDQDRCLYGPLLQQSKPDRVAALIIIATLNTLSVEGVDRGISSSRLVTQLGKVVEHDIHTMNMKTQKGQKTKPVRRSVNKVLREHHILNKKAMQMTQPVQAVASTDPAAAAASTAAADAANQDTASAPRRHVPWAPHVRLKLAGTLVQIILETCRVKVVKEHPETKEFVSQEQPAFAQTTVLKRGKKMTSIMPNPQLVSMMMKEPRSEMLVSHQPMIVPPEPWTRYEKGGYLDTPTQFIRTKPGEVDQKIYAEAAIARGDVDPLFKGLDVLGRTPWRINHNVLRVMVMAWNTGERVANMPPLDPDIPIPPEPANDAPSLDRRKWMARIQAIENEKSGYRSNRCFMNYQLEIARTFRNHIIYFPHNLDFRGRAYPLPPHLNHMGADHARGILMFGKGRKLGERGLMWLKVHLANLYGFDKASLAEREAFAMDNLDNVYDSANHPLDGKRWWLQAEDPWQTLATCFELKAALESPDPTKFVSHLPVHQDGTCNGLQHYAALGGDEWGARQVNLQPGERPADVYTAVANLVKTQIQNDTNGKTQRMASALVGKITRKVVKQTVMTNVYGVTFAGARDQVAKQLVDLYPDLEKETGQAYMMLAGYIAAHIFSALDTMFQGARDIQAWLGEAANRICLCLSKDQIDVLEGMDSSQIDAAGPFKRKGVEEEVKRRLINTIVWTTPLRLPVAQPYREMQTKNIKTCLQMVSVPIGTRGNPVNRRKQLQGFPPNFIHSMDATHMILSALACDERGLTFAAVHDSFWTHASDVDTMNTVLRDAFVRIHEEDVIGRLKSEFMARYEGSLYLGSVSASSEEAKEIKAWRKEARKSSMSEALLESKRQKLLNSDDPAEVEIGETLITPMSILEKYGDPHMVARTHGTAGIPSASLQASKVGSESGGQEDGELADDGEMAAEAAEPEEPAMEVDDGSVAMEGEGEGEGGEEFGIEANSDADLVRQTMSDRKRKTKAKPRPSERAYLWLSFKMPPVPEKGSFDVQTLRDSKYFFS